MKMRVPFVILLPFLFAIPSVYAQTAESHQTTTVPPDARYEIVQSTLAVKATYRLDRFSGLVYQLVETKDGDLIWELMRRRPHPENPITMAGKPIYQLFTSGLALKCTYLMNVNTGATWQLVETADKELLWTPLTRRDN